MTFHQAGHFVGLFVCGLLLLLPPLTKCNFDRESLEGRRTGTRERKGTSPEMFVAAVRGTAIKCSDKKSETKTEKRTLKLVMITREIGMVEVSLA